LLTLVNQNTTVFIKFISDRIH